MVGNDCGWQSTIDVEKKTVFKDRIGIMMEKPSS